MAVSLGEEMDGTSLMVISHLVLQFLLIFRKAAAGELQEDSGLHALARLSEIDVSTEGVKGAKSFFEAKVSVEQPLGVGDMANVPPYCTQWGQGQCVTIPRHRRSPRAAASRRRSVQSRRRRGGRRRR